MGSEEEAANAINEKCEELGLSPRNKGLDPSSIPSRPEKTRASRYTCVYWSSEKRKWLGQFMHNRKRTFVGYFKTELEAAKAVNRKCLKLGIKLKNPNIDSKISLKNETSSQASNTTSHAENGNELMVQRIGDENRQSLSDESTEEDLGLGLEALQRKAEENKILLSQKELELSEKERLIKEQKEIMEKQEKYLEQLEKILAQQKTLLNSLQKNMKKED